MGTKQVITKSQTIARCLKLKRIKYWPCFLGCDKESVAVVWFSYHCVLSDIQIALQVAYSLHIWITAGRCFLPCVERQNLKFLPEKDLTELDVINRKIADLTELFLIHVFIANTLQVTCLTLTYNKFKTLSQIATECDWLLYLVASKTTVFSQNLCCDWLHLPCGC